MFLRFHFDSLVGMAAITCTYSLVSVYIAIAENDQTRVLLSVNWSVTVTLTQSTRLCHSLCMSFPSLNKLATYIIYHSVAVESLGDLDNFLFQSTFCSISSNDRGSQFGSCQLLSGVAFHAGGTGVRHCGCCEIV